MWSFHPMKGGGSVTESTKGFRLPYVFGQRNASGPAKEKRWPHEVLLDDYDAHLPAIYDFKMIQRNLTRKKVDNSGKHRCAIEWYKSGMNNCAV